MPRLPAPRFRSLWVHALNAVLLLGYGAAAIASYRHLPDQIPVHFGLSGVPDRFAETSWPSWMGLFFVALGLVALLYGCAWIVYSHPQGTNMPRPDLYRSLPPAVQREALAPARALFYWTTTGVLVLLATLQWGMYLVATGARETLPPITFLPLGALLVVVPLAAAFLVPKLQRRTEEIYREHQQTENPDP